MQCFFMFQLILTLLDWYPRVGCSCVSCADVGTIARAQPESELPVGLGPNGQPPPVGVDGIPIGGSMPGLPVQPTSLRKQCCPYDFDSSLCKYHDDRVLCGYNKNLGVMRSVTRMIPKGDGCRLRGGRIECGYHESPYYGIRRPPARDAALPDLNNLNEQRSGNYPVISTPEAAFDVTAKKELLSNNDGNLWPFGGPGRNVESKEDSSQPQVLRENEVESITEAGQWVTRCVEINNRIVCNRVGKPAEAEE